MTCFACHTSWNTSCFGCHLPMKANRKMPSCTTKATTRNWTDYNFQTLRDDIFMLGRDGTVTGNRIAPVRSACAVLVGSQNQHREWIYSQQQTISAEGSAGRRSAPSCRTPSAAKETQTLHRLPRLARRSDNNAWMAQLLMQGTNFVNFIGRYAWVATGRRRASRRRRHRARRAAGGHRQPPAQARLSRRLREVVDGGPSSCARSHHHPATNALDIQVRGEYLYVGARAPAASASTTSPTSTTRASPSGSSPRRSRRSGQQFYVKTKNAVAVAAPTTLGVDPTRTQTPENEEQPIHPLYGYLYVADREEGLILVGRRAPRCSTATRATTS